MVQTLMDFQQLNQSAMKYVSYFCILFFLYSCHQAQEKSPTQTKKTKTSLVYEKEYIATDFDFPVGKSNAKGYYNAQKFGVNLHLGEDWNGVGGGNSDLGDTIYSVANGYVKFAEDVGSGWGNIIRIDHKLPDETMVESFYAHCDTIFVKSNTWIKKGTPIGTIGTANGAWLAHLHFEMRSDLNLPIGPGYSKNTQGYINPTQFIKEH